MILFGKSTLIWNTKSSRLNASDQQSKRCIMFTCPATFALACQIAVWLTNANATLLPPYWRFEPHHIKAIVDTAYEESRFRPCIKSRDGSVGLWQWRGSRREYLHQKANTPPTTLRARIRGPPAGFDPSRRIMIASERPHPKPPLRKFSPSFIAIL
jgi:hypothetical protein